MQRRPLFTPEELEELKRIDAELDAVPVSNEEAAASTMRDRIAIYLEKDKKGRRLAEYRHRYYEANKEKLAEYQRQYYEANKEELAEYRRRYREANKEELAEYQRRYREANKEKKGHTNGSERRCALAGDEKEKQGDA